MSAEQLVPYVVNMETVDPAELMFNAGRGVQTVIADEEGRIVAAVVPVGAWFPGAQIAAGTRVMEAGEWITEAVEARVRRRAAGDEAGGPAGGGRL